MEDIQKWIDLVAHSNIVTAVDSFRDIDRSVRFQLVEHNNGGNMYAKLQSLYDNKDNCLKERLNLNEWIPLEYIEMVYDATIQIVTAIDFAHNSKLIHGQLDLSKSASTKPKEIETPSISQHPTMISSFR